MDTENVIEALEKWIRDLKGTRDVMEQAEFVMIMRDRDDLTRERERTFSETNE